MPDALLRSRQAAAVGCDRFIPIRKSDLLAAMGEAGGFADANEYENFRRLCEMLASICHYEYFAALERLRNDYYYFNPAVTPHAAMDQELIERSYADLVQTLDRVLKDANFVELPHEEIGDAHSRRTVLRVAVKASLADFREVRFYWRGRHVEQFDVHEWFGLRRRKETTEVYDDVIMLATMKSENQIHSRRRRRALERRKLRPGSVLLKCFCNIASGDINALFPNARVVMSSADKLVLGIPALAGGIPILLKIYATITVLLLLLGFYFGVSGAVEDSDMKTALAALSGLAALGGFVVRQWLKYQRQSLRYQIELTDNVYYRNVNNNAGVFDYVIGAAEEQECKEAFLAYYFLHTASAPLAREELEDRIEAWLLGKFGVTVNFKVGEALERLQSFGLLGCRGAGFVVPPLGLAIADLRKAWSDFFAIAQPGAAE